MEDPSGYTPSSKSIDIGTGSSFVLTGAPSNFAIYSNQTGSINFGNGGDFSGMLYAPNQDIVMNNGGNVYGMI